MVSDIFIFMLDVYKGYYSSSYQVLINIPQMEKIINRNSAMTMTNSMAFISQFGEYNPGGGKDEVLKYLNEAQKQVILAEKALKAILDCVESSA